MNIVPVVAADGRTRPRNPTTNHVHSTVTGAPVYGHTAACTWRSATRRQLGPRVALAVVAVQVIHHYGAVTAPEHIHLPFAGVPNPCMGSALAGYRATWRELLPRVVPTAVAMQVIFRCLVPAPKYIHVARFCIPHCSWKSSRVRWRTCRE